MVHRTLKELGARSMQRPNKGFICGFFLIAFTLRVYADDGIYGLTEIDYFNMKGLKKIDKRAIKATVDKSEAPISQDLWIEPAISADGKVSYYRPPQVVVDFLDDPTKENGKAYIEWNQQKLAKITKAQEVLQELVGEMNLIPPTQPPQVASTSLPKAVSDQKTANVVFFLLRGCPYCEKQKELIENLFKNRPDLHIEVFGKNYTQDDIKQLPFPAKIDDGLSRQLGLNTYPSVFIENQYGKKLIMPGLIDQGLFETLLGEK